MANCNDRWSRFALFFLFVFFIFRAPAIAAQPGVSEESIEIGRLKEDFQREVKRNSEELAILRRDQINYKIEKDLLKESYSSTLQSISTAISLISVAVGFVFTAFGYIGFKSIGKLKEDYSEALRESKKLKDDLESEILALERKQKKIEGDVAEVIGVNDQQARRIQLLELTEKIGGLVQNRHFDWALEHIKTAMEIDSEFPPLLKLKAITECGLKDYRAGIISYRQAFDKDKKIDTGSLLNCMEVILLFGDVSEYREMYNKYKAVVDAAHSGFIAKFFEAICCIRNNDLFSLKASMRPVVESSPPGNSSKLGTWNLSEVDEYVELMEDGELKDVGLKFLKFFVGQESRETLLELLR
ncbi:hypothetical protein H3H37_24665 [Duganella sp. LX20W]|uniref:Tetratricopeptide repeat-containing protein n=1 Tax=Rugamonas brunnea TaxID=2758569 RepID=A0A7W2EX76_9BURK|nr:hypothetical protein [Rugamonas brunnea]MBA5640262.1 hypothetical protein [Rugamonas brunnea]